MNAQKPTPGRIVLVAFADRRFNGADVHPAIVTHVFSETLINARVMVDGADNPPWCTSLPRKDTAEGYRGDVWFWPPRE